MAINNKFDSQTNTTKNKIYKYNNMCGIFGFIGKPNSKTKKTLRALALLNQTRGIDSTGLTIIRNNNVKIFKKAVNSAKFWDIKTPSKYMRIDNNNQFLIIMGHTRHATIGEITDKNAHPFKIGDYIITHNGQISNFYNLQNVYNTYYEVDSQIVGYLLNVYNETTVFEKKIQGWFTIPYINLENRKLLKIATHNAPLSFAYTFHGLYYSSEMAHLQLAFEYSNQNASFGKAGNDKLYTISFENNVPKINKKDLHIKNLYSRYYYMLDRSYR